MSHTTALSKPRDCASNKHRALFGYKQPAFASTGIVSSVGRRNGDTVIENPFGGRIGASQIDMHQRVDSRSCDWIHGLSRSAQYNGRIYSAVCPSNFLIPSFASSIHLSGETTGFR